MTSQAPHRVSRVLGQIAWPVAVGGVGTVAFYAVLLRGPIRSDLAIRYFTSHPVSYIATGMFFVGLVALLRKSLTVAAQFASLGKTGLGLEKGRPVRPEDVPGLIEHLEAQGIQPGRSYLGDRLRRLLQLVASGEPPERFHEECKYLADMDAARQHESYALVRILIWAIPMLGFLGTVIGITQALGNLDP